jgi:hypothetical protein
MKRSSNINELGAKEGKVQPGVLLAARVSCMDCGLTEYYSNPTSGLLFVALPAGAPYTMECPSHVDLLA